MCRKQVVLPEEYEEPIEEASLLIEDQKSLPSEVMSLKTLSMSSPMSSNPSAILSKMSA